MRVCLLKNTFRMMLVFFLFKQRPVREDHPAARVITAAQRVLVGAVLVGMLDVLFRADLWGHGHETLSIQMIGARAGYFLVALAFAKVLATGLTLAVTAWYLAVRVTAWETERRQTHRLTPNWPAF